MAELTVTLNVRLPPSLKAKLDRMAEADHRTLSSLVQMILERAVAEAESKRKR